MTLYSRPGDDISRGLVGFWKLDDLKAGPEITTAIDQANFNDGLITGATNIAESNGPNPYAMDFDGVNDKVEISNADVIDLDVFSYSFWMKVAVTQNDTFGRIVSKIDTGTVGWDVEVNSTVPEISLRIDTTGGVNQVIPIGTFVDGLLHNLVICIDAINGNLKTYVDGKLNNSGTFSQGNGIKTTEPIRFGKGQGTLFYTGMLSNVKLYNRMITDGEASKLHRLRE